MFGNKFAADEIARNFQENISKLQSNKKTAAKKVVSPEDFLVSPEEPVDAHGEDLNSKIEEVSSYAKDDLPCEKCKKVHYGHDGCKIEEVKEEKKEPESNLAEDMSYLVDKKAQYVLHQLGKIAGSLRGKKKSFAADMVEATAMEIKDKTLKKAAQKLEVVNGLKKMASESYQKGDKMTGDVISVTIENIKKSS